MLSHRAPFINTRATIRNANEVGSRLRSYTPSLSAAEGVVPRGYNNNTSRAAPSYFLWPKKIMSLILILFRFVCVAVIAFIIIAVWNLNYYSNWHESRPATPSGQRYTSIINPLS